MLDIQGKNCLVIGGGDVASRKITSLLECDAKVTVIAPEACDAVESLGRAHQVKFLRRKYQRGDIIGFFLVIAATNSLNVNREVAQEALSEGILVNVVDHSELSSFLVPSVIRRGDLTVAVGTRGKSPLLARLLREKLESLLPMEFEDLLIGLGKARADLKQKDLSATEKRRYYEEILRDSGLMERWK
jgi:siroheme synthase-like protein